MKISDSSIRNTLRLCQDENSLKKSLKQKQFKGKRLELKASFTQTYALSKCIKSVFTTQLQALKTQFIWVRFYYLRTLMTRVTVLLTIISMLILSSCTVEKRRYFKGYHITWHGKKNESIAFVEKDSAAKEKSPRIAPPKEVMQTTAELFDSTFQNKSRVIAALKTQKQKTTKAVKNISEKISFHPLTLDTFHASITPRYEKALLQNKRINGWTLIFWLLVIWLVIELVLLIIGAATGTFAAAFAASEIAIPLVILCIVLLLVLGLWLLILEITEIF